MTGTFTADIRVQSEAFDAAAETAALTQGQSDVGAVVAFTGLCRSEGGRLAALELEHYPGMAEIEIGRIADEAALRWPLCGLVIIHRFGLIASGDVIVLVAASAAHRQPAFEAASFLMDFLKTRAPFWKREHLSDGTKGGWIAATKADDEAEARWSQFTQR